MLRAGALPLLFLLLLVLVLHLTSARESSCVVLDIGSSLLKAAVPSRAGGAQPLYFQGVPALSRASVDHELDRSLVPESEEEEEAEEDDTELEAAVGATREERSLARALRRVRASPDGGGTQCTHPLCLVDPDQPHLTPSLRRAFRMAGFSSVSPATMLRPLGVAYLHGFHRTLKQQPDRYGLVVDVGSSRLSLSLVHPRSRGSSELAVHHFEAVPEISTTALVDRLMSYMEQRVLHQYRVDISEGDTGVRAIRDAVREETERSLIRMYQNRDAMWRVTVRLPAHRFDMSIDLHDNMVEKMAPDLLRFLPGRIREFLHSAHVSADNVLVLALSGGGAVVRDVRERVKEPFGRDVVAHHTPLVSAAVGAMLSQVERSAAVPLLVPWEPVSWRSEAPQEREQEEEGDKEQAVARDEL